MYLAASKTFIKKYHLYIGGIIVLLALVAAYSIHSLQVRAFGGGSGTITDPYVITTCAQLESINDDAENLNKNYVLGNDINCIGTTFIPIGFGLLSGNGTPYTSGQHDD